MQHTNSTVAGALFLGMVIGSGVMFKFGDVIKSAGGGQVDKAVEILTQEHARQIKSMNITMDLHLSQARKADGGLREANERFAAKQIAERIALANEEYLKSVGALRCDTSQKEPLSE